ncbi:patatin-like phospholipase family protein [Microbulbifer sp. OS29]|uniref:Patatin-like phospholipase family protein n=1 Tax=Microbulbifer okhotskensis TaxID=2926617 RepID=A0A9X2ERS6_9GAMM|nr:patatin-like phospholipase family protein [Microbulbifer okhotskensis]MCO1336611.1 patatin-like phospholipase family protein [Microbulbifer okhotskensis]
MAIKILSIDGGGIRGILPGEILVSLEHKLKVKSGNPDARIGEYFDLIAGTSTGALLGAAYICPNKQGKPKFSAQQAVNFYLKNGQTVFGSGSWPYLGKLRLIRSEKYTTNELERSLKKYFGKIKLSDLLKPSCFVSYDIQIREQIIFRQHSAIVRNEDFLVRDLLRGCTAAPTYFEPARIYSLPPKNKKYVLIDGGMVASDPALCAYSEAIKFDGVCGIKDMIIVSLGTGKQLKGYKYKEVKDWGIFNWARPAIDIAVNGGAQMTHYYLKQISSTAENTKYYRIQPKLYNADSAMDNASPENLRKLKKSGQKNAENFDHQLEEIATILVNNKGSHRYH